MVEINKKVVLWVVVGIMLIGTIFLTLKASSIGTAQAVAETTQTAVSSASSGMVGGC